MGCEMSVVLLDPTADNSNKGSSTGSVLHEGVAAFHRTGQPREGLRAMKDAALKFPKADIEKATAWYDFYIADPANQTAQLQAVETWVRVEIDTVVFAGTLDQLRIDAEGIPRVWDLKTGGYLTPEQMLDEHEMQQAAYVLAARATLDPRTLPGGLIRTEGYGKKRGRVWLPMRQKTAEDCRNLLLPVVDKVKRIRTGATSYVPSQAHCRFCPIHTCDKRVSQ